MDIEESAKPKSTIINQLFKYFIVALLGLFVDFIILFILHDFFGVHYLFAAAAAFTVALAVNYALSSKYVFKNAKYSKTITFALFGVVGLVGVGILSLAMWLFTDLLGLYYLLSKCLATVIVYAWNFVGRRALYNN